MSATISTGPRRKPKCKKCSSEFPNVELRRLHLCQNRKYEKQAIGDSRDNHEKAGAIGDSRDSHEKAVNDSEDDIQMVSIRGDTNFLRQAINQEKVNIKEENDHISESNLEISNENNNESNNNLNERLNSGINPSVDTVFKSEIDFRQDNPNQGNEHQSILIRMSQVSDSITQGYERDIEDSEEVKEDNVIQDELENDRQGDSAHSRKDAEQHRDNEVTSNLGQSSSTQPHLQTTQTDRRREITSEGGGNNNNVSRIVTNNPGTVNISINVEMSATSFVRLAQDVFGAVNVQQTNVEVNVQDVVEDVNAQQNVVEEDNAQQTVVEDVNAQQTVVVEQNEQKTLRGRKRSRTQ